MAKINKARFATLGMLALAPASGYDIKKKMANSTDHFWKESDGALYPTLKQLHEDGLVTVEIENPDSGKPKKIYTITEDGFAEFQDWMAEDFEMPTARDELLLKIFFGSLVDKSISEQHITDFRYRCTKILTHYQNLTDSIDKKQHLYPYLTLLRGIMGAEMCIRWCDEALKLLEE